MEPSPEAAARASEVRTHLILLGIRFSEEQAGGSVKFHLSAFGGYTGITLTCGAFTNRVENFNKKARITSKTYDDALTAAVKAADAVNKLEEQRKKRFAK